MPFKAEVIADSSGKWVGNSLVFPDAEQAADYAADLASRWTLVRDTRVVETDEEANYTFLNGYASMIGTL